MWTLWDRRRRRAISCARTSSARSPPTACSRLDDFIRGSGEAFTRDGQIGSIGGGNHFVEIQRIEEIFDGATARDWGLRKGTLAIMAHSGSVGIGHLVGRHFSRAGEGRIPPWR